MSIVADVVDLLKKEEIEGIKQSNQTAKELAILGACVGALSLGVVYVSMGPSLGLNVAAGSIISASIATYFYGATQTKKMIANKMHAIDSLMGGIPIVSSIKNTLQIITVLSNPSELIQQWKASYSMEPLRQGIATQLQQRTQKTSIVSDVSNEIPLDKMGLDSGPISELDAKEESSWLGQWLQKKTINKTGMTLGGLAVGLKLAYKVTQSVVWAKHYDTVSKSKKNFIARHPQDRTSLAYQQVVAEKEIVGISSAHIGLVMGAGLALLPGGAIFGICSAMAAYALANNAVKQSRLNQGVTSEQDLQGLLVKETSELMWRSTKAFISKFSWKNLLQKPQKGTEPTSEDYGIPLVGDAAFQVVFYNPLNDNACVKDAGIEKLDDILEKSFLAKMHF